MDIFSILVISSEYERIFSQLRFLIIFEQTCLGDATIESDECQKYWLASSYLVLKDSNDEDNSELQYGNGKDIDQSNEESAIILSEQLY